VTSRDAILSALRRASPPAAPLPAEPAGIVYPDPVAQFLEAVKGVGGSSARVGDGAALGAALEGLEVWRTARRTVSLAPGAGRSTVDLSALRDPHELEGLDVAVVPGELGVAENGAVWVPGKNLGPHRAVFVITQHLVLTVPASAIVSNMQEAYGRLTLEVPGYGLFISGPSKTADIEQALVIGAHGARSCTVFVVG
jgi:L-lactate dehydrogenase complex protein LldG